MQAQCLLTAWPEWCALYVETSCILGNFIFEEILCRWGAVSKIITDNSTAYITALDWLTDRYGIHHIYIMAYNSQVNSIIEQQHHTIWESIFKTCEGNNSHWLIVTPFAFWADCAIVCKSTSYSPFYMVHSVEPVLPFDLIQATFLIPNLIQPLSTEDLLAVCTHQLQKYLDNLASIHDQILASHHASIHQFEKQYANTICNLDFTPGSLILVHNTNLNMDKMKP